ncbi:serine hydrolase domain-containing protein [Sphingosinicella rhizophila]|uniref:Serine hydrolase domain-containing protein n=1 Tax=Sphingosinicella rhizophila TaxID=3050082 RepID=A0ABU3Q4V7_9SPHN|nr:serine hydrolase domain-containing protein [Sphingosinicella sp. GR2756]MDT9598347.1 serine hydrolase domain-containing protein [Sphingosinicella sp. GR2756]
MAEQKACEIEPARIDAIFAAFDRCDGPGAAVGISVHGCPAYRKAFGLANAELPIALTTSTRMRIASMSKHFACLAFMLLVEDGLADAEAAIGTYLPELAPATGSVTATQLMGHISGIRDVVDMGWQFGGCGRPVTADALLGIYRWADGANAPPGERWIYNNGGILLLTRAIERLCGLSLEQFLNQRIFGPAGLHDTMLRRWDTDFVPNSAALHMTGASGEYVRSYLGMELTGDAGVVSTIDDMLRWLAHMDRPRIGSEATWRKMLSPLTLNNGFSTNYGLGIVTEVHRGVELLYHDGGVMGGSSRMLKAREYDLDIVVISNCQDANGPALALATLEACLPDLDEEPVDHGQRRTGIFLSPDTGRALRLFTRDEQQFALVDGFEVPLVAGDNGLLTVQARYRMLGLSLEVEGADDHPSSIRLQEFGHVDTLVAVPSGNGADGRQIAGRYRAREVGAEAQISADGGEPILAVTMAFGTEHFALEPLTDSLWRARPSGWWPPGGILAFEEGGSGLSFRFTSSRTRGLRFERVADVADGLSGEAGACS